MLTDQEFEAILTDPGKRIEGNITWDDDEDHSPAREFRVEVLSEAGWPLQVYGWWSPEVGQLSYSLFHRREGRIVGLDLGDGLIHHNPDCHRRRRRTTCVCPLGTHKQKWSKRDRMRRAYVPSDITAIWNDPVEVWDQFCQEIHLGHIGTLATPHRQREMEL